MDADPQSGYSIICNGPQARSVCACTPLTAQDPIYRVLLP